MNRVVPDDVALAATHYGAITIVAGEGDGGSEVPAEPPVDAFARHVLETLQDDVIEAVTKTGWPPSDPARPDDPQRAADLPTPHAEVVGDELHCWYGSGISPALRIPPIPLPSRHAA